MVWARTKLMIHDDLFRPRPKITIHYTGPHPEKFYQEIPLLLTSMLRVHEHTIIEKKFEWGKGEPEKFNVKWEVNKDLDKFSYYWVEVSLSGFVSKGHGTADIEINAALRTEYPQDTYWERSLFYEIMRMFWHSIFYSSKRERYMLEGRRTLTMFADELKRLTRG
jgi:hypothetical protein